MWSAVEHDDYLSATQLYLFARHVHTSLTTTDVDGSLAASFPVIERQWAAIAHFNDAIYDGCQKALASPDTDPVFDFLAALYHHLLPTYRKGYTLFLALKLYNSTRLSYLTL